MNRFARLRVERLEARNVPTATAVLVGTTLTITGGPNRDRIDVDLDPNSGNIVVRDAGQVTAQFAPAAVAAITIDAGAGDDDVSISQDVTVPATINGGSGDDLLFAGGGPTTLDGGPGDDKVEAGSAPTTLLGGAGNDLLIGRAGVALDTVDGGPGADAIQRVTTADVIAPDLQDTVRVEPAIAPPVTLPETPLAGGEVNALLKRAAAATSSDDGIVAVVDRQGRILGIRVEGHVDPAIIGDPEKLTFAIDGAVAEARTAAFFANDQAPLTSRTVQFISQSTITQREVEADPNVADPLLNGPGFVAPVGVGGHFPPNVPNTPQVDLFEIEHTNRDTVPPPGEGRFDATYLPGQDIQAPESYGVESGYLPTSTIGRGIATLPGGIPLYKKDAAGTPRLVGGIGVFFPGKTGYADAENSALSSTYDPTKPDRSLEAEYIATLAASGLTIAGARRPTSAYSASAPASASPATPIRRRSTRMASRIRARASIWSALRSTPSAPAASLACKTWWPTGGRSASVTRTAALAAACRWTAAFSLARSSPAAGWSPRMRA